MHAFSSGRSDRSRGEPKELIEVSADKEGAAPLVRETARSSQTMVG